MATKEQIIISCTVECWSEWVKVKWWHGWIWDRPVAVICVSNTTSDAKWKLLWHQQKWLREGRRTKKNRDCEPMSRARAWSGCDGTFGGGIQTFCWIFWGEEMENFVNRLSIIAIVLYSSCMDCATLANTVRMKPMYKSQNRTSDKVQARMNYY